MMKLVNLIRDALVVILALFTSFGLGMIVSTKIFEKVVEGLYEEPRRNRGKVSYRDYAKERYEDQ